jgi:hypothetical protein
MTFLTFFQYGRETALLQTTFKIVLEEDYTYARNCPESKTPQTNSG